MLPSQYTNHIMMVRPANFGFNPETADSNSFQVDDGRMTRQQIAERAVSEFDAVVQSLLECNVDVFIVDDSPNPVKTDAIFPNNWISFHRTGQVVTYPMMSKTRRLEIRPEIIQDLEVHFSVSEIWPLNEQSADDYLEGTGSMVLDRANRIVYACRSPRTNEKLLGMFCERLDYRSIVFDAVDDQRQPIYHTNVMMFVTEKLVGVCLQAIPSEAERTLITESIRSSGKDLLVLRAEQINQFAGNMLQVGVPGKRPYLVMSKSARESLDGEQVATLEKESELLAVAIPVIEQYGGGSIRCMLAEIFLPSRD